MQKKLLREIERLRILIDDIDIKIADLLNNRAILAKRVGQVKKKLNLPIYISKRETEILKNIRSMNSGDFSNEALERIFKIIINETRLLEQ